MFNVQCPGCSAPYQVNERRVPAGGLRMRCPKCATSFVVEKPSANQTSLDQTGAAQVPSRSKDQPRAPSPLKATMIGVAGPALIGAPAGTQAAHGAGSKEGHIDLPMPGRRAQEPMARAQTLGQAEAKVPNPRVQDDPDPAKVDLPSVPRRKPPPPARSPRVESDLPAALAAPQRKRPIPAAALPNIKLNKLCVVSR